jgi:hypothetical protein
LAENVYVVDADGGAGADFTSLQAAVDGAADGDILLVRNGFYDGFSVSGKALSMLAFDGANVLVAGDVTISGIPTGAALTLRGLALNAPGSVLEVSGSGGSVRLEDLDLTTTDVSSDGTLLVSRIVLKQAAKARLSNVRAGYPFGNPKTEPGSGGGIFGAPASVLSIESSDVHLHQCEIYGTPGRDAYDNVGTLLPVFATEGGDAIEVIGASTVRLVGSLVRGGPGGDGLQSAAVGCVAPEDGGAGVHFLLGQTHSLSDIDSEIAGGAAGAQAVEFLPFSCPAVAQAGSSVEQEAGTAIGAFVQANPLPRLAVDAILEADQPITFDYLREPGDEAIVAVSLGAGPLPAPGPVGIEVSQPIILVPLGIANGLGSASVSLPPVGDILPAGVGITLYVQAVGIEGDLSGLFIAWVGQFATAALVDGSL